MNKRLSWDEIVKLFPKQYVYLTDVQWKDNKGQTVSSAIVIHATTRNDDEEYILKSVRGECVEEYTDHEGMASMGGLAL